MNVCIGSFSPQRSALDALHISYPAAGMHMKLYCLPPNDVLHSQVVCTLGVILSGVRSLHHIVLIEADNSFPVYNDINEFSDRIFSCESNSLMTAGTSFTLSSSTTLQSSTTSCLGMVFHPHQDGFMWFVCLKPCAEVTVTSSAELLNNVANMCRRPRRKRSTIAPVFVQAAKGWEQLRTHAAHDAAHVWMITHANDAVKIDFVPQGGKKSVSLIRRFQVKNARDEYVVVRTLKECIEYVQERTGRNFWDDMANDGHSYDFTSSMKEWKKMSCEDLDESTHADLFGSDSE